jgi:hypothetical protein
MNELPRALQPVLVIREVQLDGSVDEGRLYLDGQVSLFTDGYVIESYHCTPATISMPKELL